MSLSLSHRLDLAVPLLSPTQNSRPSTISLILVVIPVQSIPVKWMMSSPLVLSDSRIATVPGRIDVVLSESSSAAVDGLSQNFGGPLLSIDI
ncbi:hypothetical protein L2E82_25143 [Cichorium intybus]|uniref:Uncharacterized protein n=1 Tax=Cichorium intybus TaxID=13427 RepID=A0ACB9E279_CICIN|nr:hypothetical protein L2E82_25143 [Cichorium intybus]